MRFLSLDIGDVRIGIAMSDPMGIIAQGVESYTRTKSLKQDLNYLKELIESNEVDKVIIGLPKNMNGTLGPQAEKVKTFAEKLGGLISQPLIYWDERLSTVSAEKILIKGDVSRKKRKTVIDKMAAVVILQSFLDSSK